MKTHIHLEQADIQKIVEKYIRKERAFEPNEPLALIWHIQGGVVCIHIEVGTQVTKKDNFFDVGDESGT